MNLIKVGAAALNQTPLDWKRNRSNILRAIDRAENEGCSLLCLPELCITGYGCEDMFTSSHVLEEAWTTLEQIKDGSCDRKVAFCVGLPIVYRNALYNVVAFCHQGQILGFVPKQNLAGDGPHYEPRWFKAWPAGAYDSTYQFGDQVFAFETDSDNLVRVGFEICEDAFVAERTGAHLARRGVDVILNPSASHFSFGKAKVRERLVLEASRAYNVTYVYANLLGNEAGRIIYDGDRIIASGGALKAVGNRFSNELLESTYAVVDLDVTSSMQLRSSSFRPDLSGQETLSEVALREAPSPPTQNIAEPRTWTAQEEFLAAVPLALSNYYTKSHTEGFVISLSGGADSAACAILVHEAWKCMGERPPMRDFLTCVYQKARYSSETTLNAARAVAEGVGAKFLVLDVEAIVDQYKNIVFQALEQNWDPKNTSVAEQNIQARVRSPSVWLIANLENKLLLTTSNRSEAAVGYCTMDGDTSGGLAPLAGIDKAFILDLLKELSESTYPFLKPVVVQKPTAELAPNQTDESDLMPYPILEAIEELLIRDQMSTADTYKVIMDRFKLEPEVGRDYVNRFARLWRQNQWKRERYAPGFRVDDRDLDPRSSCRHPILSGPPERV